MRQTILIYQMGKVGSWTILVALLKAAAGTLRLVPISDALDHDFTIVHTHDHDSVAQFLGLARSSQSSRRIVIISGVRDPLYQMVAAFFQNIDNRSSKKWYLGPREDIEGMPLVELIAFFRTRLEPILANKTMKWFHTFSENIGFDVYSVPFPHDIGFLAREFELGSFAIVRTENLSASGALLGEFAELGALDLQDQNVTAGKWSGDLYERFKAAFVPTESELDYFYRSEYPRHFYSEDEIDRFIKEWKPDPCRPTNGLT